MVGHCEKTRHFARGSPRIIRIKHFTTPSIFVELLFPFNRQACQIIESKD
jgi:hypothetical protein